MKSVRELPRRAWRWLKARWEWRWPRRLLTVLSALVLVGAALVVPELLPGPDGITDPAAEAKARNDLRNAAIQSLGVLAILVAGWYTARTYRLGHEGHLTDRFKAGVDLLAGSDVSTAGGMLALERVARDSPRDHPVVMELLAMFARVYALSEEELRTALMIIGRRELRYDHRRPFPIDLRGLKADRMTLVGLNLDSADLSGASFNSSSLRRLVARKSLLDHAQLEGVDLQQGRLDDADLKDARLSSAVLVGAELRDAHLTRANLSGAVLMSTDFSRADLSDADLSDAQLHQAVFAGAVMTRATLRRSWCSPRRTPPDFSGAVLAGVSAEDAILPRADFRNANLTGATLDGAVLVGADFRGATFAQTSLRNCDLTGALTDDTVAGDVTGATGAEGWRNVPRGAGGA